LLRVAEITGRGLRWLRGLLARPLLRIRYGQPLSIHPFEKVPLHELLTETKLQSYMPLKYNKLMLLGLQPGACGFFFF
jgi:hypothetical protein